MSETTPYFEDNNRKGATRGEAIFGDKHAQFELTSEGEQQAEATHQEQINHVNNEVAKHNVAENAIGELAARSAAKAVSIDSFVQQHGDDISQEQLDKITNRMR